MLTLPDSRPRHRVGLLVVAVRRAIPSTRQRTANGTAGYLDIPEVVSQRNRSVHGHTIDGCAMTRSSNRQGPGDSKSVNSDGAACTGDSDRASETPPRKPDGLRFSELSVPAMVLDTATNEAPAATRTGPSTVADLRHVTPLLTVSGPAWVPVIV